MRSYYNLTRNEKSRFIGGLDAISVLCHEESEPLEKTVDALIEKGKWKESFRNTLEELCLPIFGHDWIENENTPFYLSELINTLNFELADSL